MSSMESYVGAQPARGLLHLTFQHFPARYLIFKDTRVNIYFMRMTGGESYNNSHKSEHEICNCAT